MTERRHVADDLADELLVYEEQLEAQRASEPPPPTDDDAPSSARPIDPDDPRPQIVISTALAEVVDAAERAMLTRGSTYVRGRQLVSVVRDRGCPDWLKRPDGAPVIAPMTRESLLDALSRGAIWIKILKDNPVRAAPPPWAAALLLSRGEWNLPQLDGISDSPVLRADGSVHDIPGYDSTTRIIFDPCGSVFAPVPLRPTHAQATRALADLMEPFSEFPFVADCDRAATAALVLSVLGRSAIDGNVPMFSSQAPTPGSGKGLLVDVASMIATGRRAPLMAPTEDDDETRKRLLAIAIESPAMVVIDNVEGAIGSPSLAMALTAGQVSDRQLGSTKMVTASLRPVWCCTGNNVQLKGDLGRRVVPIDLDPKVEHPEDRKFQRGDLLAYVSDQRPRLVVAGLTVLRAYMTNGSPEHGMPVKGSFETWDKLIRGAVYWACGVDPLDGVQRIRDQSDDDLERIRALLFAWEATMGSMPWTISDAIRRSEHEDQLRDALAAFCKGGRPEARPLGYAFRRLSGRVVCGLVMSRAESDRNGLTKWSVRPARQD